MNSFAYSQLTITSVWEEMEIARDRFSFELDSL